MKRAFIFGVIGFAIFARVALALEPTQTGFRVVEEKTADGVTVIIKSDYCIEYTVSFDATLVGMRSSRPLPFTADAAGRSSFVLAHFTRTTDSPTWRYQYHYHWEYGGRRNSTDNNADYAMPFRPGRYVVLQGPGGTYSHFKGSGSENAVDWDVPEGTTVCAAREGRVVGVRGDSTVSGPDPQFKPLGNYIIIKHADGTFADYHHLRTGGALVKIGDEVRTGQPIGYSGKTGFASKPHLHFMVFQAIDGTRMLSLPFRLKTDHGTFTNFVRGQSY